MSFDVSLPNIIKMFSKLSLSILVAFSFAILSTTATPVKRAACTKYTIIDTRGTGEPQGPSAGFRTMNSNIRSQVSGGDQYDTVYPAGSNQDSSQGTRDIINKVQSLVNADSSHCIVLEGYSQGAAATVNALSQLSGNYFNAVKAVFLIGDPLHKPNLACNVDPNGGTSTKSASGISYYGQGGIPSNWIDKTLDVCITGDGVCSRQTGYGITYQHLSYPNSQPTQNLGTKFVVGKLQGSS